MKGDLLASGRAHTAQFNAISEDELLSDLKLLPEDRLCQKYNQTHDEYQSLVALLKAGKPLPEIKPVSPFVVIPISKQAETSVEFVPDPPKVGYRGKPVGDNVLVARVEKENTSRLVIPDANKAKADSGFIAAVGSKVRKFKVGQLVLFNRFACEGMELELLDEAGVERTYLLLKEYDILMELEKVTPQHAACDPTMLVVCNTGSKED